jgi:Protein of unknown function (DUF2934)
MEPTPDDISRLAYQFYLEDGKPEGFALDHWKRAEEFLRHPENHSGKNVLAVPSEPEITRALDEKAVELDTDLPSDPRTGEEAVHQKVELAVDPQAKRGQTLQAALKHLPGIERIHPQPDLKRVTIYFDARLTNPAAIHEAAMEHTAT